MHPHGKASIRGGEDRSLKGDDACCYLVKEKWELERQKVGKGWAEENSHTELSFTHKCLLSV